jgi:hypothetical protein
MVVVWLLSSAIFVLKLLGFRRNMTIVVGEYKRSSRCRLRTPALAVLCGSDVGYPSAPEGICVSPEGCVIYTRDVHFLCDAVSLCEFLVERAWHLEGDPKRKCGCANLT